MKQTPETLAVVGIEEVQRNLKMAFEKGLRQDLGDLVGGILVDVLEYRERCRFEPRD